MEVFDDDHNGTMAIDDVIRVMKTHEKMDDEECEMFIKRCVLGPKITEEEEKADFKDKMFEGKFNKKITIKEASENMYNK